MQASFHPSLLTVTNNQELADRLAQQLRKDGVAFHMRTACSQEEAVRALKEPFDAVLVDLRVGDYLLPGFVKSFSACQKDLAIVGITDVEHADSAFATVCDEVDRLVYADRLTGLGAVLKQKIDCAQKQRALRQKQGECQFQQFLVDTISEAVIHSDLDHHILSWNHGAEVLYGWHASDVVGRTVEEILRPQYQAGEGEHILEYFQRNGFWKGEVVHIRKDGSPIVVLATTNLLKDEDGRATGIACVNREQAFLMVERVSRALRTRSECNQILARASDEQDLLDRICQVVVQFGGFPLAWVGYAEDDTDKRVRPVAKAGSGVSYLDHIQVSWADNIYGRGPSGRAVRCGQPVIARNLQADPSFSPWLEQAIRSGFQSTLALPLSCNGRIIGTLNIYAAELDGFSADEMGMLTELANDLAYGIEAMRTRTAQKKAEMDLRDSEERYRLLFSSGNDAVFVYPLDDSGRPGNFSDVNEIACQGLGYTRAELLQRSFREIAVPGASAHTRDVVDRLKQNGQLLMMAEHKTRDGRIVPVEINSKLFHIGEQQMVISIARDITERVKSEQKITRQLEQLSALQAIDQSILTKKDLTQTLDILLEQIIHTLQVDGASLLLFDPVQKRLFTALERGLAEEALWQPALSMDETHAGKAALSRKLVFISDLRRNQDAYISQIELAGLSFSSFLAVPMEVQGELKGVLQLFHKFRFDPDEEWFKFMRALADQAAIAIDNAQLVQALKQTNLDLTSAYDKTIEGWARALDLRDHETEGHSRRVTDLAVKLSSLMGIGEDEQIYFKWGTLLHDIGKVGVPDDILLKKGPLDDKEWSIMRKHPEFAAKLLTPIKFLSRATDIAFYHHEKWDGSGYPYGLKKEGIPLSARIFAVVDVWDALTSDRPYRKAWSKEQALNYILEQRGHHFDPDVADVFLEFINGSDHDCWAV